MIKNTTLFFIAVFILVGCASYKEQYREETQNAFPDNAQITKSFYLIGDAGKSPINGKSEGLRALEQHIENQDTKKAHLIFLGDNIYPVGMPDKDDSFRSLAENHLNAQIAVAQAFDGKTIFIPGNHDWYDQGLKNVEREKDYIEKALKDKNIWEPKVGCPLESIEISDDVQLIILDSQWYLAQWDKHPTINDDCDQIKTREQLFLEIEGEFKKNQDKVILVAMHHPLYTNGVHGGQYAATKHLFPTQRNIPLPLIASLVNQVRTSGGISSQDKQNERYQEMVNRVTTLARSSQAARIIFASGHEHTLQYIENDGIRQIVSGSGSKQSYATLSNDGLFAYGGKGFARFDILKDGSGWVRYYTLRNGKVELIYTVQAIEKPKEFDIKQLPSSYPAFAKASIYETERTDVSGFYESVWGNKYRDLYGIEVNAKVALLDTLYGGLEVVRAGGGHQTRALRLKDKDGKEYNIRALKKSAVQFLQTTVFKENQVVEGFENTTTEDLLFDFYTAAHPYAALTIPDLASAVGVYHTNPEVFYLPKQQALGKYNNDYGDELYLLVERPEENHKDLLSFGKPDDIESTADVFERLRRDEKYKIDEPHYIKARIFDMLIGDWDRHQDQWRWSEFELEDGTHLFRAIPRDRDQVYSNFDGALFATLRTMIGITNQFATYDEQLTDVKWFNTAANYLDRALAQNSDRFVWESQARYIQENLTDEQIENAFKNLPAEIYPHESTQVIVENMKKRRDNLLETVNDYYDYLASLAIMTGTDKDDIIEINRIEDGKTEVTIYRNKDGEKADIVAQRVFDSEDTNEIWIYALDDDDIIKAMGTGKNKIKVRVIGGQNNDIYDLEEGKAISIYDHKSKDNTFKAKNGARVRLSDNYDTNLYNPRKNILTSNALTPAIGFNPDDGFKLGIQNVYTVNGFNRNPHTRVHKITAGYYFATNGYDVNYTGEFAGVFNGVNLLVNGRFAGPTFTENFFGIGNDSENLQDDFDFDYNRVRISEATVGLGIKYNGEYGSNLTILSNLQGIEVEEGNERFITDLIDPETNPDFYERKWYVDTKATYNYESYDNKLNPTRGMIFETTIGGTIATEDVDQSLLYFKPKLGFYNAISRNRKWVIKSTILGQINVGNNYQFFQLAELGQNNGLRGYRTQRFSGQRSFAASGDLRYSFNEFKTGLIPLQMGLFAGADVGRVWVDGEFSDQWHNDFGGGFWVNSAEAIGANFNFFHGDDGLRFSFQVGFSF
ncbi:metallophosphoesterase [Nonlabens ulvanivorans]|uniref:metallophosphoesterase n=1 Tax=Nonlabens ulvanivorans TaxID=906888 RepID=UPI0037C65B53